MIPAHYIVGHREAPEATAELARVAKLPRRPPPAPGSARALALVALMTRRLRRERAGACDCRERRPYCLDELLLEQAWALYEARIADGLVAAIGVGGGKTGLNVLAPMVVSCCARAVLFLPPTRLEQFWDDHAAWAEHFCVPHLVMPDGRTRPGSPGAPVLHVVAYSRFSRPESTTLLRDLEPDLVVADEAHCLRNTDSARGWRALSYFATAPRPVRLCCWSGTLFGSSLMHFQHLAALALGEGSPLPVMPGESQVWAGAVDVDPWPAPAGALKVFCSAGEDVRAGVARRLRETRGFVVSVKPATCAASLVLLERRQALPERLAAAIAEVGRTWTRPDGEELLEALEVARCLRELSSGFFNRWRFPGNPPRDLVDEWFAARKAYNREARARLQHRRPHMDSPQLLEEAAERHRVGYEGELPTWDCEAWPRWREVMDAVEHETEAVWLDDYLVRDAAEWATSSTGVVWYGHDAFGQAAAKLAGLPLHSGGPGDEARIRASRGDRSIFASIKAHGQGLDGLQLVFCDQLVANPPASDEVWEQLLGRLHRLGQRADEVRARVYRHAAPMADAVDRAVERARATRVMSQAPQKLLIADVEWSRVRT